MEENTGEKEDKNRRELATLDEGTKVLFTYAHWQKNNKLPMCVDMLLEECYTEYRQKCIEFANVRDCCKGDDIMQWYEEVLDRIDDKKIYCHKELMDELRKLKTDLSESTYHWAISGLVRDGGLTRLGYDSYSLSSDIPKDEYMPVYSDTAERLIRLISEKYPYVQFTVFETVLMNEFLNHLIAQNTVFIQVEKESSIYVFRFLQDQGIQNVMYKPGKKDFNLYWAKDSVIVTDMISEAPIRLNKPHYIMLEKMLVDISADKLIATTFSKAELPDVYEQAQSRYLLDKVRMLRYARRRNQQDVLLKYLEGSKVEDATS